MPTAQLTENYGVDANSRQTESRQKSQHSKQRVGVCKRAGNAEQRRHDVRGQESLPPPVPGERMGRALVTMRLAPNLTLKQRFLKRHERAGFILFKDSFHKGTGSSGSPLSLAGKVYPREPERRLC